MDGALEVLCTLVREAHDALWLCDPKTGATLAISVPAARLIGWSPAELEGNPKAVLIPNGEAAKVEEARETVQAEGAATGEGRTLLGSDGEPHRVDFREVLLTFPGHSVVLARLTAPGGSRLEVLPPVAHLHEEAPVVQALLHQLSGEGVPEALWVQRLRRMVRRLGEDEDTLRELIDVLEAAEDASESEEDERFS